MTRPDKSVCLEAVDIINKLPTGDYVEIMQALANLGAGPKGPDGAPYNERWPKHANPLLVIMWHDLGITYEGNDCGSWCAVALSWCLKRSGHTIPVHSASSQAYLNEHYGTVVKQPAPGDIVVFTDFGNAGKGHVTIFRRWIDANTVEVLGGNQQLSAPTNCTNGFGTSVVDQRPMAVTSKAMRITGFVRPPAATKAPSGPAGSASCDWDGAVSAGPAL